VNKKLPIVIVAIVIAAFLVIAYLAFFQKQAVAPSDFIGTQQPAASIPSPQIEDEILKNALNLYASKKQAGIDFSTGPCLGKIADDWVLDIANNPREDADDKPENQCQDYVSGRAHHFVELDPDGNLIRTQ